MDIAHDDLINNIKRTFTMLLKEVDDADIQINETFDKGKWATILISAAKEGVVAPGAPRSGIPKMISPYDDEDEI